MRPACRGASNTRPRMLPPDSPRSHVRPAAPCICFRPRLPFCTCPRSCAPVFRSPRTRRITGPPPSLYTAPRLFSVLFSACPFFAQRAPLPPFLPARAACSPAPRARPAEAPVQFRHFLCARGLICPGFLPPIPSKEIKLEILKIIIDISQDSCYNGLNSKRYSPEGLHSFFPFAFGKDI